MDPFQKLIEILNKMFNESKEQTRLLTDILEELKQLNS